MKEGEVTWQALAFLNAYQCEVNNIQSVWNGKHAKPLDVDEVDAQVALAVVPKQSQKHEAFVVQRKQDDSSESDSDSSDSDSSSSDSGSSSGEDGE